MNFKMTPVFDKTIQSCFVVTIQYEHGDADAQTTNNTTIKSINLSDLEKYIQKFNEIQKHVDNNRAYGTEYPQEFKEVDYFPVEGIKAYINLERDQFCDQSDYFAGMRILEVLYYDEVGQKFNVTWRS